MKIQKKKIGGGGGRGRVWGGLRVVVIEELKFLGGGGNPLKRGRFSSLRIEVFVKIKQVAQRATIAHLRANMS